LGEVAMPEERGGEPRATNTLWTGLSVLCAHGRTDQRGGLGGGQ
jgi:hypothetical protein